MANTKLVLSFPPRQVREPITYGLVKEYDLKFNILRASISPDEKGHMVLELDGTQEQIERGCDYLRNAGVSMQLLSEDIRRNEERCVHCTACTTVCPSGALSVQRPSMEVAFDSDKCIGCGLCIPACMYHAMEIRF